MIDQGALDVSTDALEVRVGDTLIWLDEHGFRHGARVVEVQATMLTVEYGSASKVMRRVIDRDLVVRVDSAR